MPSTDHAFDVTDGALHRADQRIDIPDVEILQLIAAGANAFVYEARDIRLDRRVAVKIWKPRGQPRSLQETAKIASLNHPLVINTHLFAMAGDLPYAVIEHVDGPSVTQWLTSLPSISARRHVWCLFATAIRYVYDRDMLHGDPHTGNILTFPDPHGVYRAFVPSSGESIGIKLADAGTSQVWSEPDRFSYREARLLRETGRRLFHDQDFDALLELPDDLPPQVTLAMIDSFATYVNQHYLVGEPSLYAPLITRHLLASPYYRLTAVLEEPRWRGTSNRRRVIRGLHEHFLRRGDLEDDHENLRPEALAAYEATRQQYRSSFGIKPSPSNAR